MVKYFIVTGDCHGVIAVKHRIEDIILNTNYQRDEMAVIILGDASVNFWLTNREKKEKKKLKKLGVMIYCVRGNHEERPENLGFQLQYDENVGGEVYVDDENDMLRYFQDGGEYVIDGFNVLTIGGAYSVDKDYRIAAAGGVENSGWFPSEQLSEKERTDILAKVKDKYYDFIFTHTAPLSWEPTDLFLSCIDQSKVDKTTELFLQDVAMNTRWCIWCFGHYHADRAELPCVEQFYNSYRSIREIFNDWTGEEQNWRYLNKSPDFWNKPTLKGEWY
jgi:3-oxoacid CoA-transferase subunit A